MKRRPCRSQAESRMEMNVRASKFSPQVSAYPHWPFWLFQPMGSFLFNTLVLTLFPATKMCSESINIMRNGRDLLINAITTLPRKLLTLCPRKWGHFIYQVAVLQYSWVIFLIFNLLSLNPIFSLLWL